MKLLKCENLRLDWDLYEKMQYCDWPEDLKQAILDKIDMQMELDESASRIHYDDLDLKFPVLLVF